MRATHRKDAQALKRTVNLPPQGNAESPARAGSFGEDELIEEIARSGMGVEDKARHVHLGRVVALQRIRADLLAAAGQRPEGRGGR